MKVFLFPLLLMSYLALGQNLSVNDRSYFWGREYYVLRSGDSKMVVQCDKADVGSAFSYLLYDAEIPSQSSRKQKALNYDVSNGFSSSSLKVILKQTAFQALGHNLTTNWRVEQGVPSVEANWWASGIKVKEVISSVALNGTFKRTITLESADLVDNDTVSIQLSLPLNGTPSFQKNVLVCQNPQRSMAIVVMGDYPVIESSGNSSLKIGPLALKTGQKIVIESYLLIQTTSDNNAAFLERATTLSRWIQSENRLTRLKWSNSNTIRTQDTVVQNLYNNCRFILPAYVSDLGKMDAGIFEYGGQWVRDASNTALGIIHIGEFELARAILENMLKNMIKENGTTMISNGFDNPDREQFDQMGEFMHVMKAYTDWTGDFTLLREYRQKIVNMVERPLRPEFRDSTSMVHNKREFWERTFDDAYELAYQSWVIEGLRDAAALSTYLNSEDKAVYWRKEADKTLQAMLSHPTLSLVENNHLIKRRNITSKVADKVKFRGWVEGAPAGVEQMSRLMPDASITFPISLNLINPESLLAKNTLTELEKLWNERWSFGGYDRYHTSSQGDQPGPWTFATTFMLRAQHEAKLMEKSRRSLDWLYHNAGGRTGAWFEEIPTISAQAATAGLIPWTSAEVAYFVVHHLMGIKFNGPKMVIKPVLYANMTPLKANLRFKAGRIAIEIKGSGAVLYAIVNEKKILPNKNGEIEIPENVISGSIQIFCNRF